MNVALLPTRAATLDQLATSFARTAAEHDLRGVFPRQNLPPLFEAGLLSLTVPRAFGGQGAGLAQSARVIGTLAQGDPATALILTMQTLQHANLARARRWPEAVYEMVARSAVRDGALINALRVEPELGTPARGGLPATVARRTATGWRISGHKIFCTGIPVLTWLAVWARTDEDQPRMGMFLVPANAPGLRVVESWDHLGMRATESHDVFLDDVDIPAGYAVDIRPPAEWTGPDPQHGAWNAVLIGSLYHGVASAARDWLAAWLRDRVPANLGAPLASLPRIQTEFGAIDALLRLDRRLLQATADTVDRDGAEALDPSEPGLLKQRVTANAIDAVQRAVAMAGNAALARRNPLERHLRDVLCGRIHTPQDDSVFLAAGRAGLKDPQS
jgi:alkylation response protein AidB-like acyl-CoA dehydrogenase